MAIKRCQECGEKVSSSAKTCPHCGKKHPVKKSLSLLGMIIILLFVMLILKTPGTKSNHSDLDSNKSIHKEELETFKWQLWTGFSPDQRQL